MLECAATSYCLDGFTLFQLSAATQTSIITDHGSQVNSSMSLCAATLSEKTQEKQIEAESVLCKSKAWAHILGTHLKWRICPDYWQITNCVQSLLYHSAILRQYDKYDHTLEAAPSNTPANHGHGTNVCRLRGLPPAGCLRWTVELTTTPGGHGEDESLCCSGCDSSGAGFYWSSGTCKVLSVSTLLSQHCLTLNLLLAHSLSLCVPLTCCRLGLRL